MIGAGLAGCEFTNDLALAGYRVSVVDPGGRPLATLLPEAASAALQDTLQGLGVRFHWGTTVRAVHAAAGTSALTAHGLALPYVMPIMAAARALAATLAGTPTELAFALMPASVKTPALPLVVASPQPGTPGQWHATQPGLWQWMDDAGAQRGFVLAGAQTAQRMVQSRLVTRQHATVCS